MFVKIRDLIKFKGFLVEFLESRRSSENQKPPENHQKIGLFLSLAFYNAPSLRTVNLPQGFLCSFERKSPQLLEKVARLWRCRNMRKILSRLWLSFGFGKRGLLEKGSFQKSPFSRESREFRDSRDSREPPDCGKQRRIRPFLEILENLEILEILEIPPVKRPLS